jgi:prepilin peptidase CpaA
MLRLKVKRGSGGGDAKVAAGVALWFGFDHLLNYLVYASLLGGALTLLLIQFRQWPLPSELTGQAWLLKLRGRPWQAPGHARSDRNP